jgi:hypothetical protein
MIMRLFLMALLVIAVMVSTTTATFSPTLAQNMTIGNTTDKNSTQSLTTSKERGAYSDYGG